MSDAHLKISRAANFCDADEFSRRQSFCGSSSQPTQANNPRLTPVWKRKKPPAAERTGARCGLEETADK